MRWRHSTSDALVYLNLIRVHHYVLRMYCSVTWGRHSDSIRHSMGVGVQGYDVVAYKLLDQLGPAKGKSRRKLTPI